MPSRALRILVPTLALGATVMCNARAASADWRGTPNYAQTPWNGGVNAQSMALPKPDITRTGRDGSKGWGLLRRFNNTPVTTTLSSGDMQHTATATSKGWAFVSAKPKADGYYRVYGFVKTKWKSETTAGGDTVIQRGRTSLVGSTPLSVWTARTGGPNPIFARGHEFVDRHKAEGYWTIPRKGSPENPRMAGTYTRVEPHPAILETANDKRARSSPMAVAQLKLADQYR